MEIRQAVRRLLPAALGGADRGALRGQEHKVVFADYYQSLATSGIHSSYRSRPWPVERACGEAYERIVWVYRAVNAIASHSSRLPFRLRVGNEEPLKDHPLYRVLNRRANPLETGEQFRQRLAAQVLLSKRGAFAEITRSRGGDVIRMDLLPPGRTRPVPSERNRPGSDGQDLISHYEVLRADGSVKEIPVDNVRWFRQPHPLDPYSGVTPLEAAGLSVELDFFSRLYNVSFLKNDARPGGVLAIDGELDPGEMDRVEGKFGKGPAEAGKLTVIHGQVSYIDLAVRPRDMQYSEVARTAKTEILAAFGVPESVIGYAADRTFDNAEQEFYNFWSITMPPFLTLLASGLDVDFDDDLDGFFDTTGVEVLQRVEVARREEARKEFDAGLISVDEYRAVAKRDPIGIPRTRALFLPMGKLVVATSDADQKTIDEENAAKVPAALQDNAGVPGQPPDKPVEKPPLPGNHRNPQEQRIARCSGARTEDAVSHSHRIFNSG
ncbi:phage portal protein, partial [Sphaerisporangium sp. NPDC049002]|uniref:phage portal protein n=1 Tax=Sphaerisporangium sp. NPDC049002 TaxID=3155392 RepID=UPI0033CCD6A5